MKNKKQILFVIYALGVGGAENSLVKLLNKIKDDYNIDVLLLEKKGYWIDKLPDGINLKYLFNPRLEWIDNRLLNFIRKILKAIHLMMSFSLKYTEIYYKIVRIFKIRKKYDVEIAYLEPGPVQFVSTASKNTRKIHSVRNSINNPFRLKRAKWYLRRCEVIFPKMDCFYCVSGDAMSELNEMYPSTKGKSIIINNMFNFKEIKKKATEKINTGFKKGEINIVTVGRFNEQKGFPVLVEAHKKLIDEGIKHNLHIIGRYKTPTGSYYGDGEEVVKYMMVNDISDSVFLHGEIDNPFPFVKQADLYVSSSHFEGFPRSVAEALIINTPVLATNVSGTAYALGYGAYGMLVDNSVDGLYKGLKKLITDRKERDKYKKNAAKFKDDNEAIIDKIKQVINGEIL